MRYYRKNWILEEAIPGGMEITYSTVSISGGWKKITKGDRFLINDTEGEQFIVRFSLVC